MHRRRVLAGMGLFALAPFARAQRSAMRRVAIAVPHAANVPNEGLTAFRQRLGALGWIEGRNVEYVTEYANGDPARYAPVIAGLLAKKPDVLFAYFQPMTLAAMKQTREVPIVFAIAINPEKSGLVASLARPGGNVTGTSTRANELDGKRIELLRALRPGLQRMAVLVNPANPAVAQRFIEDYGKIARTLGLKLLTAEARTIEETAPAFERMLREGVQGVLGTADPTHLFAMRTALVGNAARVGLPMVYVDERYVEAGGLASYGTDNVDQIARGSAYVDKILRGAKPADLPVEEPTNYRMSLNLRAARALGMKLPQALLLRADQVIE